MAPSTKSSPSKAKKPKKITGAKKIMKTFEGWEEHEKKQASLNFAASAKKLKAQKDAVGDFEKKKSAELRSSGSKDSIESVSEDGRPLEQVILRKPSTSKDSALVAPKAKKPKSDTTMARKNILDWVRTNKGVDAKGKIRKNDAAAQDVEKKYKSLMHDVKAQNEFAVQFLKPTPRIAKTLAG